MAELSEKEQQDDIRKMLMKKEVYFKTTEDPAKKKGANEVGNAVVAYKDKDGNPLPQLVEDQHLHKGLQGYPKPQPYSLYNAAPGQNEPEPIGGLDDSAGPNPTTGRDSRPSSQQSQSQGGVQHRKFTKYAAFTVTRFPTKAPGQSHDTTQAASLAKMKIASVSSSNENDVDGTGTGDSDYINMHNTLSGSYSNVFRNKYNFRSEDYWRTHAVSPVSGSKYNTGDYRRSSKGDLFDKDLHYEGNLFQWDAETGIVLKSESVLERPIPTPSRAKNCDRCGTDIYDSDGMHVKLPDIYSNDTNIRGVVSGITHTRSKISLPLQPTRTNAE